LPGVQREGWKKFSSAENFDEIFFLHGTSCHAKKNESILLKLNHFKDVEQDRVHYFARAIVIAASDVCVGSFFAFTRQNTKGTK
jgi:hypothetical protein